MIVLVGLVLLMVGFDSGQHARYLAFASLYTAVKRTRMLFRNESRLLPRVPDVRRSGFDQAAEKQIVA